MYPVNERFVVIGAGAMGVGIAYVAANAGYAVELVEISPAQQTRARETMTGLWATAVARGRMSTEDAEAAGARLAFHDAVQPGAAVVVEAVPERVDLKRQVLAAAEASGPGLLASNTSSIPIGTLAEALADKTRFLGLHFFNPVWAMSLLEIVVGADTGETTVAAAREIATRLGKEPIVVKDMPGFATSRLGVALGLEAIACSPTGLPGRGTSTGPWSSATSTRSARWS